MNWGKPSAPSAGSKGNGRGAWAQSPPAWGPPSRAASPSAANGDKKYVGTVKAINAEKAWGHIACPAIFDMYGKDVFLRRSEVEAHQLETGMMVSFRIAHTAK